MAGAKGMKSSSKSFSVFEFKEEDELTGMTVKRITTDFGCTQSLNAEKYAEKMPELSCVLPNDFDSHGRATEIKNDESGIVFSNMECGSSLGATLPLEDHLDNAFQVSSCNVKSVCLASDAVNNMSERSSSDFSNNNASPDGLSSDNNFGAGDLDEREGIFFYSDFLTYRGTQYMDYVVIFSRSYVEARSRTTSGDEEMYTIHLELNDIVKIESQWGARVEAGVINIYFIANGSTEVESHAIQNLSGIQELKFPAVDSNWHQKCEAIKSLEVKYKGLWNVLLDTGVDSSLREREDWMPSRSYFPKFDRPFEEVIYPKGDPDAVSISKRDASLLLPDTFVNDTIIDFYIKYLKTRENVDEKAKFHFFNSFFFRKLSDMDKDPSSAFDGKAAFQRVRKWTRKVNLLEKDFILIPVNYNLHWSLIVICYFGEVGNYKDGDGEPGRVPCILHMDSLRGTHSGLKDLMQSYLWEEWKERQKEICEDLHSKFRNLKFVPLEVPQQLNSYDCGLFLLHYVELFLEELPANFSIYKISPSSEFLREDWFTPAEPSIKRTHIERLISGLVNSKSEECPPSVGSSMHRSPKNLNTTDGFEDGIQFTIKSGPLGGCHVSSQCQVKQGIEMTLLPTSPAKSPQCTRTSGLVLKELFQQVPALESYTDAPWGILESKPSICEGEVKASECFITTELNEHVFQHPDSAIPEAPTLPYASQDYRSRSAYSGDSSPATSDHNSEALFKAAESSGLIDISTPREDSFLLKNFIEPGIEANHMPNHTLSCKDEVECPAFESDENLSAVECDSLHPRVASKDEVDPHVPSNFLPEQDTGSGEEERISESLEEQHAAKRMRISPSDGGEEPDDSLSPDLNL